MKNAPSCLTLPERPVTPLRMNWSLKVSVLDLLTPPVFVIRRMWWKALVSKKPLKRWNRRRLWSIFLTVRNTKILGTQLQTEIQKIKNQFPLKPLVIIGNKADKLSAIEVTELKTLIPEILLISAKEKLGVEDLKKQLLSFVNTGALRNNETIVTNTRHYDSLLKALEEIQKVKWGLQNNLSSDLMAIDIRQGLVLFRRDNRTGY